MDLDTPNLDLKKNNKKIEVFTNDPRSTREPRLITPHRFVPKFSKALLKSESLYLSSQLMHATVAEDNTTCLSDCATGHSQSHEVTPDNGHFYCPQQLNHIPLVGFHLGL